MNWFYWLILLKVFVLYIFLTNDGQIKQPCSDKPWNGALRWTQRVLRHLVTHVSVP